MFLWHWLSRHSPQSAHCAHCPLQTPLQSFRLSLRRSTVKGMTLALVMTWKIANSNVDWNKALLIIVQLGLDILKWQKNKLISDIERT